MIGVYQIRNKKTNFVYIGSSKDILQRMRNHSSMLSNSIHHCKKLQEEYNKKDSEEDFISELLEECNLEVLKEREQYYLDKNIERLYNTHLDSTGKGFKYSEERREQMSIIAKNMSDETKQKISNSLTGRKSSEETKEKVRQASLGRIMPKEACLHLSISQIKFDISLMVEIFKLYNNGLRPREIAEKLEMDGKKVNSFLDNSKYKAIKKEYNLIKEKDYRHDAGESCPRFGRKRN